MHMRENRKKRESRVCRGSWARNLFVDLIAYLAVVGEKSFVTERVLHCLPVEERLTPKGHVIWHKGIVPDQTVSLPLEPTLSIPGAEKSLSPNQLRAGGGVHLLNPKP
jgi:hypothetical protein